MQVDFSALANPEEIFFQHGYADGYAHGRIHGLIEGRAVGKEKGLELWEEVGYYRGFSLLWSALNDKHDTGSSDSRANQHIKFILAAIDRFPVVNPSTVLSPHHTQDQDESGTDELDITKLLTQIRSRHRALCAILGVKPKLRAVAIGEESLDSSEELFTSKRPTAEGSNKVWRLDKPEKPQPLIY